ncbi:unnamed protein product [Rodentolepis nana]|uniref:Uncharacterized protein n=1 Tax=Rodentolepis nana TaxID=102285 RepID=A0A0R3T5M6_RODNA|nr:unnamed protein product [Rodentolepis nana]
MVSERGQEDERRSVDEGVLLGEVDDMPDPMREGVAPSPPGDWTGVTSAEKLFPPLSTSASELELLSPALSSARTKIKYDS